MGFFDLGFADPTNAGKYNFGDLTKKKGLTNYLAFQEGQNQARIGKQRQQIDAGRADLQSRYGTIAGGDYQGISTEDRGILDELQSQSKSINSPEAMANYERGVLTPLRGAFDVARSKAGNRMARTNNSAGYGSMLGELAREEGRQSSEAGYDIGNEKYLRDTDQYGRDQGIAGMRFQRSDTGFGKQMQGIEGLAKMYGIDVGTLDALQGQQNTIFQGGNSIESRRKGKIANIQAGANAGGTIISDLTGLNNLFK